MKVLTKRLSGREPAIRLAGNTKPLAERVQSFAAQMLLERPNNGGPVAGPNLGASGGPLRAPALVEPPCSFPDEKLKHDLIYDGSGCMCSFVFGDDMVADAERESAGTIIVRRDPDMKIRRQSKRVARRKRHSL